MTKYPLLFRSASVLFALIVVTACVTVFAGQTPSRTATPLMIGGKSFRIGMTRTEVLDLIKDCCRTQVLEGSITLMQKTGDFTILGDIFFENGRVSSLVRNEKQTQSKETSDFVLALYRSFLNGQTSAKATVSISVFPDELSNAIHRYIILTFPDGRKIRITQFTIDNGDVGAQFDEER